MADACLVLLDAREKGIPTMGFFLCEDLQDICKTNIQTKTIHNMATNLIKFKLVPKKKKNENTLKTKFKEHKHK